MQTVPAKSILSSYKEKGWFGSQYMINLYRGCCHGCIYCDSRSDCYGIEEFDTVRAKENALEILERELASKRKTGTVLTGAMSDPYNPFEANCKLSEGALRLFASYGFGVITITKSDLVKRDVEHLLKIKEFAPAVVIFTVTTADDELCRKVEPYPAVTSERFAAMRELSEAGVMTGVLMTPILPFINDTVENVTNIVSMAASHGASFVYNGGPYCFGVTLRQNQRQYYYDKLDELFPSVKYLYKQNYGSEYGCNSLEARALRCAFQRVCREKGLAYTMPEIKKAIFEPYTIEQTSLF